MEQDLQHMDISDSDFRDLHQQVYNTIQVSQAFIKVLIHTCLCRFVNFYSELKFPQKMVGLNYKTAFKSSGTSKTIH